jgi:hypothetical protein
MIARQKGSKGRRQEGKVEGRTAGRQEGKAER